MDLIYVIIAIILLVIVAIVFFWILKKMKGSIVIVPEKYNYISGETINGNLILKLKKSVKSSKLIIGLRCERLERNYSRGNNSSQRRIHVLFDFSQPLDMAKEYAPSEYPYSFSLNIPKNLSQKLEGIAGSLIKSVQILSGQNSTIKWYLYAELQCDGINLTKKIQINVI